MTVGEFKSFWETLSRLYPWTFKREEPSPEWMKALKDVPEVYCIGALATHKKLFKEPPTLQWVYESATKYHGAPDLLYKAVMRNKERRKRDAEAEI